MNMELEEKKTTSGQGSRVGRSIRRFAISLLASSLIAPGAANAGQALVPFWAVKSVARSYDGGKSPGLGVGAEAGISRGRLSFGATATGVREKAKIKLEEKSVWMAAKIGDKYKVVGYVYEDKFFNVTDPSFGVNASRLGTTAGAEKGAGFWDVYLKQGIGSMKIGATVVGWGGKPQKLNLSVTASQRLSEQAGATVEVSQNQPLHGGDGTIQLRGTVKYEF
jgi:hypothetical protein